MKGSVISPSIVFSGVDSAVDGVESAVDGVESTLDEASLPE